MLDRMVDYLMLKRDVADHVNKWHLTDDDGIRRCILVTDCLLDQIQGHVPDDGLSEDGHDCEDD